MNKIFAFFLILAISGVSGAGMLKIPKEGNIVDNTWDCVLDEDTGLYWEVKSDEEGLHYAQNTYTWFDGDTGYENDKYSHNCHWGESCNSKRYAQEVNKELLCSFSDWRLPTLQELKTLINYEDDILIDLHFFPNTQPDTYWTSTKLKNNDFVVYEIPFIYGGSIARDKYFDTHIRLVRNSAEETD